MVLKKGTTHPVLNLLLSQFDFVSRAIQRSLRVNKMGWGGGVVYYSIFFIFLLVKLHMPLENKVKYLP